MEEVVATKCYCPECDKIVPDDEVMALVVEVYTDGTENINRAVHWPNCVGHGELKPALEDGTVLE